MPIAPVEKPIIKSEEAAGKSYVIPFTLVTSLFFLWGIANSLNGTLVKHFQTALTLGRFQAGLVDSAFYIGYFVTAIPAGLFLNKHGYKKGIIIGLLLYAFGAALFYPAAEVRVYSFFLAALFIIACGLTFLETAANPYVIVLGEPKGATARINLAQSFNGVSTILAPIIGSLFIFSTTEHTNTMLEAMPFAEAEAIRISEAHSVQMPYLFLAGVVLLVAVMFSIVKMPEISSGPLGSMKGILKHKHLVWGIVAQFFYVGSQTAIWAYIIDLKIFLSPDDDLWIVRTIYQISEGMTPTQIASYHASFGFVLFMTGRFFGTWLLTKLSANKLLATYAVACLALLAFAYLFHGLAAFAALILTYFFMSIMFPTIFSLSIKNLGSQVKLGSSLVIMAIVGGAILPPLTGLVSQTGMQNALIVPFVGFLFIFYFGWKGYRVAESSNQ